MTCVSVRLSKESEQQYLPGRAAKAQADQHRGHRAFGVVAAGTWEAAIVLWRSSLHKKCLHTVGNDAESVSGLCRTCVESDLLPSQHCAIWHNSVLAGLMQQCIGNVDNERVVHTGHGMPLRQCRLTWHLVSFGIAGCPAQMFLAGSKSCSKQRCPPEGLLTMSTFLGMTVR